MSQPPDPEDATAGDGGHNQAVTLSCRVRPGYVRAAFSHTEGGMQWTIVQADGEDGVKAFFCSLLVFRGGNQGYYRYEGRIL